MDAFDCDTLEKIASEFGTPAYVTDFSFIQRNLDHALKSFDAVGKKFKIFYSVKANSNPFVLKFLNRRGIGLDILSAGELELALHCGIRPDGLMLSGTMVEDSLFQAAAKNRIKVNLDSIESIPRAARGGITSAGIRVNPMIEAGHNAKVRTAVETTKFGISIQELAESKKEFGKNKMVLEGIHYHIGSGITNAEPFVHALAKIAASVKDLKSLGYLDIGGGYAMAGAEQFDFGPLVKEIAKNSDTLPDQIFMETGRYLVANSTVLLAHVVEVKHTAGRTFVGLNAGFNDMMRTVLYGAEHPVTSCGGPNEKIVADLVGPICESGDVFLHGAELYAKQGSLIAIHDVGAYGYSLSSNYLMRPRGPEIGIIDGNIFPMRRRESLDDLITTVDWGEFERFTRD